MTKAEAQLQYGFPTLRPLAKARSSILVVDDEPELLVAMEDLLSDEYEILTTTSGIEALRITSHNPDIAVVLSDQRMPNMPGDELLARLSDTTDASRVLITGFADLSAVVRAVNEGQLFAYVSKPWDEEGLRLTIHRAAQYCLLQRELAKEQTLFRDLMDSLPDGVYVKDKSLRLSRINRAYLDLARRGGVQPSRGAKVSEDFSARCEILSETIDLLRAERRVLETGQTTKDIVCRSQSPEATRYYSLSHAPLWGNGNRVDGVVGVVRDVTERIAQEKRIVKLSRLRKLMSEANGAMVRTRGRLALLDRCCQIAVEHGAFALTSVLSCSGDGSRVEVSACAVEGALVREELEPALIHLGTQFVESRLNQEQQEPLICDCIQQTLDLPGAGPFAERDLASLAAFPIYSDAGLDHIFVLASNQPHFFDVEEVELLQELTSNLSFALDHEAKSVRLDFVISYDQITGLSSREPFTNRLARRAAALPTSEVQFGVLWIDLSRFRQVNETLGRTNGNDLLRMVGKRLVERVGDAGSIARLDANAFGLVTPPCTGEQQILEFVERTATDALRKPFVICGREVRLSAAIGISVCPNDSEDPDVLLSRAETACKTAKSRNQPHLFYSSQMDKSVSERLELENRLQKALEQDEYLLHYQPKVHAKTGRLVGLEGLIRWQDSEGNLVPPGVFIPVLEETGLILQVGVWVVREAARQYESWLSAELSPPRIAVNVSAIQLENPAFVDSVLEAFRLYPRAQEGIDLEITESAVMGDFEVNLEKLETLRRAGVRIAIDDFGTGYSSLAYLSRLPVDALKVDRSFINKMGHNPQDMSIVTTIISLAHSLELKVIAEGVETSEQARMLALLKCDELQGFLLCRPLPADAVTPLVEAPDKLVEKLYPPEVETPR